MTEQQKKCRHLRFKGNLAVNRLEDTGQFTTDITVHCFDCKLPFQFLGLLPGVDLNGARVSVDGREAHLAIAPEGTKPTALEIIGFSLHKQLGGGEPN